MSHSHLARSAFCQLWAALFALASGPLPATASEIANHNLEAAAHSIPTTPRLSFLPLVFNALPLSSGRWTTGPLPDDPANTEPGLLHGEDGLLLATGDHADFALSFRLRFEDLRYQARLPQAGLVFAARDRRDHAAVVFDRLNGRLHLLRVVGGKPTILATSERNAVHSLHRWLWLRVERRANHLHAALSTDGLQYDNYLNVLLPSDLGPGRLGLVADIPATTFGPAEPPALLVRDSGDWTQDIAGVVTAHLIRETFTPVTGLLREPFTATFAAAQAHLTLPSGLTLPNPANRQPFRFSAFPPFSFSPPDPSPTPATLLALFHRVVPALARRDGYVRLGTADAYAATRDPALARLLADDAATALGSFAADGRTPVSFAELYPTLRVLTVVQRDALLPSAELAAIPAFARQALLRASYERGPMNRAIGLLTAIGPGLALAGDDFPEAATLREVARRVEADLVARDFFPLEDSTNYQLISLYFSLCWARDAGRTDILAAPGFRAAFDQLLDLLGPDATVPAFGDDHPSHPGVLLGLFTAAAYHFNDSRFSAAAARVHARHFAPGAPLPPNLVGEDSLGLGLALASAALGTPSSSSASVASPAPDRALILRRPDGAPHKAVLATGSGLGALHLVLDLANAYEHGHHDALALVSLVAGADSLLPDAGRYSRAAWFHNRPLVADTRDVFPCPQTLGEQSRRMMDDGLASGIWHPLSFSLRQHWIWGNFAGDLGLPPLPRAQYHRDIPADYTYDPARQSALLLALAGAGPVRLETRSARLTGPAGSRPLPEFDRTEELTLTQALSDAQDVTFRGTVLPAPLDLKSPAYDRLEFELRLTPLSPATTVALNSVIVGDADGYPKRQTPADSPAETVHVRATATAPGLAALLLKTDTRSPAGHPARLTRLVVALADHGVWVRDTFENLSPAPLHVGPAWQLATARLDPATGWLESSGLRLAIAPAPESRLRLDHHRRYGLDTPLVFSAGAPLAPGARLVRHSFLAPVSAPSAPVTWSATNDTLTLDGRPILRVLIKDDLISFQSPSP